MPRAPTALSATFAHKTVPREANTAFFRVVMLSQDLRSVLRDIVVVVWVESSSLHLHISHCWTSRGRSQARYICPPAYSRCRTSRDRSQARYSHLSTCTFPLLNVRGPFTGSILTFVHLHISSVERQGAVHRFDTHICPPAHFLCWTSGGRSQARYSHLSTCTFPSVDP